MAHSVVALQHRLPSSVWLRQNMGRFVDGELRYLVGKRYSTIPNTPHSATPDRACVVDRVDEIVWSQLGPTTLVLDEGGALHRALPEGSRSTVAGVEQTTSGLQEEWRYPVSLVCRSAAKLFFEAQIISRGILRKLDGLALLDGRPIGIIGLGALGAELTRQLRTRGLPVSGYDVVRPRGMLASISAPLHEVIARSELVLGCTSVDVLANFDLARLKGSKIFASCSSGNVEFRALLLRLTAAPPFGTARGQIGECDCTVLNGGFPLNFDREREWELFDEIILTRQLCLEGLSQAQSLVGSAPRAVMLPPATQLRVVVEWLQQVSAPDDLRIPPNLTEQFFLENSEGEYLVSDKPSYKLHSTTPDALTRMREHREPYEAAVAGLPFIVLPDVWSPAFDWSSAFYVENFPDVKDRDFLEIGSGTGVIAVFAARNGARSVVAVDINDEAVRNTTLNFERFSVKNGQAQLSDGFATVRGTFDVVTWNAPYHGARPADMLERGCTDEDYRDIRRFFGEVGKFLNPGGLVVFGFSESGDLPLVEHLIAAAGFRIRRRLSDWREGYNCMLFELVVQASSATS